MSHTKYFIFFIIVSLLFLSCQQNGSNLNIIKENIYNKPVSEKIETISQVEECVKGKWDFSDTNFRSVWFIYFDKSQEKINGGRLFQKIDYGKNNEILNKFFGTWTPLDDVPKVKFKSFDNYYSWDVKLTNCERFVNNGTNIYTKSSDGKVITFFNTLGDFENRIELKSNNGDSLNLYRIDNYNGIILRIKNNEDIIYGNINFLKSDGELPSLFFDPNSTGYDTKYPDSNKGILEWDNDRNNIILTYDVLTINNKHLTGRTILKIQ
jgi:hypothetical protein